MMSVKTVEGENKNETTHMGRQVVKDCFLARETV
jgi:hypothetical protein